MSEQMKTNRHARILKLIEECPIETQEELAERLNEEGFKVTQATVSRDIRQLGLSKVVEKGRPKYAVTRADNMLMQDKYIRVLREGFAAIDTAANLVVIHTVPGMAMAVAAALDDMHISQIVGCIAGDNTIMAATKSPDEALEAVKIITKAIAD